MIIPDVENCSCHINPPCSACVNNQAECKDCGWQEPVPADEPASASPQAYAPYVPFKGYEYKIGEGKRLHSVFYDGRSGSTMVFRGEIEGDVSAKEIFDLLGDGTFGHRGPVIHGKTFEYTKITD